MHIRPAKLRSGWPSARRLLQMSPRAWLALVSLHLLLLLGAVFGVWFNAVLLRTRVAARAVEKAGADSSAVETTGRLAESGGDGADASASSMASRRSMAARGGVENAAGADSLSDNRQDGEMALAATLVHGAGLGLSASGKNAVAEAVGDSQMDSVYQAETGGPGQPATEIRRTYPKESSPNRPTVENSRLARPVRFRAARRRARLGEGDIAGGPQAAERRGR